jgi:hypothetical protein
MPRTALAWGGLTSMLVPNIVRIAVIVLGFAVAAVALAQWSVGNRNDLTDGVVLLGAIALALILAGAVAVPAPTRIATRRRRTSPERPLRGH